MQNPLKILIKYPSRGRPERFFKSLDSIYNNVHDLDNFHVSCTLDEDDMAMNCKDVVDRINTYRNISISWGLSESKIHAINRDLPEYGDIIVVHSDDMLFTFYGFDQIIREAFSDSLDWLVHIPDNDAKDALATMYIAGRSFFDRFGYIYYPGYKSLHCDNEIMEQSQKLGRYKFVNCPGIIWHGNAAYGHMPKDEMFIKQQVIGWTEDQELYNQRKANNFFL